jgi:hypothetical protein
MRQQGILGSVQCIHSAFASHGAGGDAWENASDVCAGKDCDYPGERAGRCYIDTPQAGMGMLAPRHGSVQHVWKRQVPHKGPMTSHQSGVFKPFHGLAYIAHPSPPRLGRKLLQPVLKSSAVHFPLLSFP